MNGAILRITNECNQNCLFCNSDKTKYETIDINELKQILPQINKNIDKILVTGGEPTIHKNIIEIIKEIKKNKLSFEIVTNGSNPEILNKIIELKPSNIYLSIYSLNQVSDQILSNSKYYENRMKSLDILEKNYPDAIINIVLNKKINNEIEFIINEIHKKKLKIKLTYPLFTAHFLENYDTLFITLKETQKIIKKIKPDYIENVQKCISELKILDFETENFKFLIYKQNNELLLKNVKNEYLLSTFCKKCKKCKGFQLENIFNKK